jgi:membrane protease YdiL (CAAX protease family)
MEISRSTLLLMTFLLEGLAFATALVLSKLFGIQLFPFTERAFRDIITAALGTVFPLVVFMFSLSLKAEKIPLIRSLRKTMITQIKGIFSNTGLVDIIVISLIAGIAEEMLFRGILQAKFGIVVASVLFGLVHFVTPVYVFVTILMGLYIGLFYLVFGSLLIPVLLHFFYDFGALVYLRYFVAEGCND